MSRLQVEGEFLTDSCGRESWRLSRQTEMIEDLAHERSVMNQRDQLAARAAVVAFEHVDGEDALEQLSPGGAGVRE